MTDSLRDARYCPKCGELVEDLDGFGVLAHDKCGYCTHFDVYDGVCRVCGAPQEPVAGEVQRYRDRIDFVRGSDA